MLKPAAAALLALLPSLALAQTFALDLSPEERQAGIPAIGTDAVITAELRDPADRPERMAGRPVCTVAGDRVGTLVGFAGDRAVIDIEDLYGGHLGRVNVPAGWAKNDTGLPVVVLPLTTLEVRRAADGG